MIDSSGLVDLTTYNKVLAERQRLSVALKKLQEASAGALTEFTQLKQKYSDLHHEVVVLRESIETLQKNKGQMESQLSHSEFLLKRITKVSKSAIIEFNELKQRYSDEYERRRMAETRLLEIQHQMAGKSAQQHMSNPQLAKTSSGGLAAGNMNNLKDQLKKTKSTESINHNQSIPVAPSDGRMQKELAAVKVQLTDTILEFQKFKELAINQYADLEGKFKNELYRVATIKRDKSPRKFRQDSTSSADTVISPTSANSLPRNLAKDIQKGKKLKQTPTGSPTREISGLDTLRPQHFAFTKSEFGKLGAILNSSQSKQKLKQQSKAIPEFQDVTSSNVNQLDVDLDPEIDQITTKLNESTVDSRNLLERRANRFYEASGSKAPPIAPLLGSSKSRENLHKAVKEKSGSSNSLLHQQNAEKKYGSPSPPMAIPNTISTKGILNAIEKELPHRPESAKTLINPPSAVDETMFDSQIPVPQPIIGKSNLASGSGSNLPRALSRGSLQELQSVFEELETKLGSAL